MGIRDVRIGRPFKLDVAVESENDFATVELIVQYDAKRLRLLGVQSGSFMSQRGADATLGHTTDAAAGLLHIDISENRGGPLLSGGGSLANLEFMPTNGGYATVSIARAVVRDANAEGVPSVIAPTPATLTIRE
jgi:hypothetical protein